MFYTIQQSAKFGLKRLSMLPILALTILFAGCSTELDEIAAPENNSNESLIVSSSYSISAGEAIEIAGKVLGRSSARSNVTDVPTLEYVVDEAHSRNASGADTLAYVLNYPENSGFVIVASDRRVYPVLAFSKTGEFTFDNEIAKENFIDKIGFYLDISASDTIYTVSENDFSGYYSVDPIIQISLSQRAPWDKYVIQEHPGCPVGCVAVAAALVMSYSKKILHYHNIAFSLSAMVDVINKGLNEPSESSPLQPMYTYETAVDDMAKFLYWIGKDINMRYTPDASGAFSSDAYKLCKTLNFTIPSGHTQFDIKAITKYLMDNHIVYIDGYDTGGAGGHAWVSDGCYYCVDQNDTGKILNTYLHCDWGWGGNGNGYFSGEIFEVLKFKLKPNYYFAVKREY